MNTDFLEMLRMSLRYQDGQWTKNWSVKILAKDIHEKLCSVINALNNKPGHSRRIRLKLARFIRLKFPMWLGMLAALNWDECGRLLATEKLDPQEVFKFVKRKYWRKTTTWNAAERRPRPGRLKINCAQMKRTELKTPW
jgi:hypothetical protein